MEREIEGEVTRVPAVTYLEGAPGHAVGSSLFLLAAGLIWLSGHPTLGLAAVAVAFLISANGISIWAWNRLRERFTTPRATDDNPTRTLTANPLSRESAAELKAGAAMSGVLVAFLVVGLVALESFDPAPVGIVAVGGLAIGNVGALVLALRDGR